MRDNLGAVHSDDLRRRYEAKLGEAEGEMTALLASMEAAQKAVSAGERDLEATVLQFR